MMQGAHSLVVSPTARVRSCSHRVLLVTAAVFFVSILSMNLVVREHINLQKSGPKLETDESRRQHGNDRDIGGSAGRINSTVPTVQDRHHSVFDNATCVYSAWKEYLPPVITFADNAQVRRRYDTLPRICTTDPLPFTNIVVRSSFKAGSSFMSAFVKSLYAGNATRQRWLNETRRRGAPSVKVAFLRDPIDRFKSMYAQMLKFSNRKYHWYGDGDADWLDMTEGPDRFRTFVASIKRRFYNEHLLPQLWFLAETPDRAPELDFVGRLDQISVDWAAMIAHLGVPDDIAQDSRAFIDKYTPPKQEEMARFRNVNKNEAAKLSVQLALYEEPNANATLQDVCDIYRVDFDCFDQWISAPSVCQEAWRAKQT